MLYLNTKYHMIGPIAPCDVDKYTLLPADDGVGNSEQQTLK